jgi:hypothetical protein
VRERNRAKDEKESEGYSTVDDSRDKRHTDTPDEAGRKKRFELSRSKAKVRRISTLS